MKLKTKYLAFAAALLLLADRGLAFGGMEPTAAAATPPAHIASPAPTFGESYTDASDGGHAILADGVKARYTNITVQKSGDANSNSLLTGENAAVLAAKGAELSLREVSVTSDGTYAAAVFSHGPETVLRIADSTVKTDGSFSAGLTAAWGASLEASNLVVRTAGENSPAICGGVGGALVRVTGGTCDTGGPDSPVIFADSDVTVSDAELSAAASQGVAVLGRHSVTLENVTLTANDGGGNGGDTRRAVALLASASEPTDGERAVFTMLGGSLTNLSGDVFLVRGADVLINLTAAEIVNDDPDGVLLRAEAADGETGARAEVHTAAQTLEGNVLADALSVLTLRLSDGSVLTGAVNPTGEGTVHVELSDGARWVLTGDSKVDSLACEPDSIDLNGFTLTVGGEIYTAD